MKKLLFAISPLCVVLFAIMWFFVGLKGVFAFFCVLLLNVALVFCSYAWWDFMDEYMKEHIKD